ncbi:hypothetical protein [Halomicrococcus sp. NG-SE-24]|uniref:hypothetical protein n=1 Tax=Halomicrococcus sp. NG-SE-24 TaxID=3436928 RepID=UPI003D95FBD8
MLSGVAFKSAKAQPEGVYLPAISLVYIYIYIFTNDVVFLLLGLVAAILAPFAYVPLSKGIDILTDKYGLPVDKKYALPGISTLALLILYLAALVSLIAPVLEGEKISVALFSIMIIWVVNLRAFRIFKSN